MNRNLTKNNFQDVTRYDHDPYRTRRGFCTARFVPVATNCRARTHDRYWVLTKVLDFNAGVAYYGARILPDDSRRSDRPRPHASDISLLIPRPLRPLVAEPRKPMTRLVWEIRHILYPNYVPLPRPINRSSEIRWALESAATEKRDKDALCPSGKLKQVARKVSR